MMNDRIQQHYREIAKIYDDLWFYSEDFIQFFAQNMIQSLHLQPQHRLVDIGCGTGIYAKAIRQQVHLEHPILCVDPSAEMLAKIPDNSGLQPLCLDAVTFSGQPGSYDRILIKEAIHHIPEKQQLFNQLFDRLTPGGIFLLLLLPPKIDYPLFKKAIEIYETTQPDYQDLVQLMQNSGFDVKVDFVEYPLKFPKEKYFHLVTNRYMSLISRFDDEELAAGLAEMAATYQNQSTLEFSDRMVFLTATKS
jgi:ubiquinone/menaquinone biosynthesis C-methylase UbiE